MSRVESQDVLDFVDGRLSGAERETVGARIATDRRAAALAADYRLAREIAAGDESPPVPEAAIRRAVEAFRAPPPRPSAAGALLELVLGLIHDSRRLEPALRAVDEALRAELAFAVAGHRLDLQMELDAEDERWHLRGRWRGTIGEDASVELHDAAGEVVARAAIDGGGRFTVLVPAGRYELILETDGIRARVPELRIGG